MSAILVFQKEVLLMKKKRLNECNVKSGRAARSLRARVSAVLIAACMGVTSVGAVTVLAGETGPGAVIEVPEEKLQEDQALPEEIQEAAAEEEAAVEEEAAAEEEAVEESQEAEAEEAAGGEVQETVEIEAEEEETESDIQDAEAGAEGNKTDSQENGTLEEVGEIVDSGYCGYNGDNVMWTLDSAGVMTLKGAGKTKDYSYQYSPFRNKSVKSVVIQSGVTSVGTYLFDNCDNIISVELPETVETIDEGAFDSCNSLSTIKLPSKLESIGKYAFYDCDALEEVSFPSTLISIDYCAFRYCTKLKSINLPSGFSQIDEEAFYGCTSIKSIYLPSDITQIGKNAFYDCKSLTDVYYEGSEEDWNNININKDGNSYLLLFSTIHYNYDMDDVVDLSKVVPELLSAKSASTGVQLSWKGIDGVNKFRVYRKTAGTSWKKLKDVNGTSTTDTTAVNGTGYYYTVRGLSDDAKSFLTSFDRTGIYCKYTASYSTPVLKSASVVSGGIKVNWGSVSGLSKYRVYRKTSGTSWTRLADVSATSYTDKSVTNGTKYWYTVRGLSGSTLVTGFDKTGVYCTYTAPAASYDTPVLQFAEPEMYGNLVKWEAVSGVSKYRVYRKTSGGSWKAVGDTTSTVFMDNKISADVTYYYTVRCMSGNSAVGGFDRDGVSVTNDYLTV